MPLTRRSGWNGCAQQILEPGRPGEARICEHLHRGSRAAQSCGVKMAAEFNKR
jgi:hypothetical protein